MMKTLISAILLFAIAFTGCEKEKIDENLNDITKDSEFKELLSDCFNGIFQKDYSEIIITDSESYKNFEDSIRVQAGGLNCNTASLPYIDFSKFTLLGKFTQGGGCSVNYDRAVFDDTENKKIIYKISVEYSGPCDMWIFNWNWVCIPKLPEDYEVEFHVKETIK